MSLYVAAGEFNIIQGRDYNKETSTSTLASSCKEHKLLEAKGNQIVLLLHKSV